MCNKTEQQTVSVTCKNDIVVRYNTSGERRRFPRGKEQQRRQEVLNALFSLEMRRNNINTPTKTD